MEIPATLAVTGRVRSWLDDPSQRLPVSCTVFVVEDDMEDPDGIEASWVFASKALRNAAGVAIHLSKLRPKGTDNGRGLVASGPISFARIYSMLNEVLRRGGTYKNGAITLHLDYDHPDALEFISAGREMFPWAKRALNVDDQFMNWSHLEMALRAVQRGDLWLVKKQTDKKGNRIYHNVCCEILLDSRGTCLLSHVNLGACEIDEISQAFVDGMQFLCELHGRTGVDASGIYLSPTQDKQVGLGLLGLANLLAQEGITYEQFVIALEGGETIERARKLASALRQGYKSAAAVAKANGMVRAFTVAPTASCSYQHRDRRGYVTCPEISPPIGQGVDRDSSTFGVQSFDYPPEVETAQQVGWDVYMRLHSAIQTLMDETELGHAISTNWWSDMVTMDREFIASWLKSPLKSLYYSLQVMEGTQDKSQLLGGDELDYSLLGLDVFPPIGQDIPDAHDLQVPCVGCAE